MPNGGVPIHMVLYPRSGDVVFYCVAGELRVYQREEWARDRATAQPICVLSTSEAGALAWQLKYWLGDGALQPGYRMSGRLEAEYDF